MKQIDNENEFEISLESKKHFIRNYLLFAMLGSGANWLLPTILFQEIPWFQDRSPEGLCLATYLNTCNSFALIGTLTYCYINQYYKPISHSFMMPIILWISVFATFFAAFTHSITAFGTSICLMITTFFGATVGSLSAVIFNPFMTQYENIYITAARSGASASFLLCALLGIVQSPGSKTRFSPTIFLIIFGFLFFLPIIAYHIIIKEKIGLRSSSSSTTTTTIQSPTQLLTTSNINSSTKVIELPDTSNNNQNIKNPFHSSNLDLETTKNSLTNLTYEEDEDHNNTADHYHESDQMLCIKTEYPWLSYTIPYALSIGFVNFNTWGMLSAVTPFAMEYASTDSMSGSFLLALSYEIGCFTLVAGDASTAFVHLPFQILLPLFAIFSAIVYAAALKSPGLHDNNYAGPILVTVFCLGRFLEAHIVTESFRAIATHVPKKYREDASRVLGIADQISTVLGVITSSILVSQLSNEC